MGYGREVGWAYDREVGWARDRVGELPAVRAANLRWLAGYRHPRFARAAVMAALAEVFAEPGPLRAAITVHGPRGWQRHEQERLAAVAGQPLERIARLYWPDPRVCLRDIEGFHKTLRPACRRCAARYGITEPVACHLLPHHTLCRRHRLWTGPAARTHDGQLDISPFPEVLRAQRRHLALAHHHDWWHVDTAVKDATLAIYQALHGGTCSPGQRRRIRQLAPATWQQTLAGVLAARPGQPGDRPGHPVIEIAIYPDVVWLAARSLQARSASYRTAV